VSGECMPEGMAADMLDHSGFSNGLLDRPLKDRLMKMVAPFFPGCRVLPPVLLGKDPLPAPVCRGAEVLPIEGAWKLHTAPPLGLIFSVNRFHPLHVVLEQSWRHDHFFNPVFQSFRRRNRPENSYAEPVALSRRTHRDPSLLHSAACLFHLSASVKHSPFPAPGGQHAQGSSFDGAPTGAVF
jgi:hypothetical protein